MASATFKGAGKVLDLDVPDRLITVDHDDMPSPGMAAMTMVFTAKGTALLDKVKAGDKVKFQAANEGGKLVVTAIDVVQ